MKWNKNPWYLTKGKGPLCARKLWSFFNFSIHGIATFWNWLESLNNTWLESFMNGALSRGPHSRLTCRRAFSFPSSLFITVSTQQRSRGIIGAFRGNTDSRVYDQCLLHQSLQMVQMEGSQGIRSCTPYSTDTGPLTGQASCGPWVFWEFFCPLLTLTKENYCLPFSVRPQHWLPRVSK